MSKKKGKIDFAQKRQQIHKANVAGKILVVVGVIVAAILCGIGFNNYNEAKQFVSSVNVESLGMDIYSETKSLRDRQAILINKGVIDEKDSSDEEGHELYLINKALDTSYNNCGSTEFLESEVVGRYCTLRTQLDEAANHSGQTVRKKTVPYFFGAFVILIVFIGGGLRLIRDSKRLHEELNYIEEEQ